MAGLRSRMLVSSLALAAVVSAGSFAAGAGAVVCGMIMASGLVSGLICSGMCAGTLNDLRREQFRRAVEICGDGVSAPDSDSQDVLRALMEQFSRVLALLQEQNASYRSLLEQIAAAEETLGLALHGLMTGDEKEVIQVRDAVSAMEGLNRAFTGVIAEIEDLSGRTDERASISAEMSATTDAIAENINQYSSFVLETSSSIEEMARAIRETAGNIRGLSASTQQTAASISLISASQSTVQDNAVRGAAASENVRAQAQQGLRSMAATLNAMQEIEKSNDESFDSINRLSRYSARVGEFLNVIQEVVEQTNLLSLNASIIAAQAGERGRAFAVVAEEVRSLAHRTSASTREIEDLVRNIQKETSAVQRSVTQGKDKVKEGVKISALANDALVKIERSAEDASGMVSRIAGETSEQAAGIQRIAEEAEKNLERVQQITISTEHQQQGTSQIVKNLEHMRELAHRINSSAQEQAKGNRLYLRSVMEDNERTKELKEEASRQIEVAERAVSAVRKVDSLIAANAGETRQILEGFKTLDRLVQQFREENLESLPDDALQYE